MTCKTKMYELKKNLQLCQGQRSCGICADYIDGLAGNSRVKMAAWALESNCKLIDQAIMACPVGALELEEI